MSFGGQNATSRRVNHMSALPPKADIERMNWRELETFSFGDNPSLADQLLALVLEGKKRATCWAVSEGLKGARRCGARPAHRHQMHELGSIEVMRLDRTPVASRLRRRLRRPPVLSKVNSMNA